MAEPKTLLQMAGATGAPPALSSAVVVVIDAQNEYVDGKLALPGVGAALDRTAELLRRARSLRVPVIHVAHKGRPGGLFDRSARSGAIADKAAPAGGEIVVEKALPNAFAGTDLEARIRGTGRDTLVLCGFMTHMCVSATARCSLDLGFKNTIVADACATRDLPDPTGGPAVDAATLHRAELAALADRFAIVTLLADLPD
jgi:nicotinamidase-related amidase